MTVALITGANSGIGRSAAVDLAAKGWTVYGSMRSLDKGAKLAEMAEARGVTVHPVVCDVTDTGSVNRAVAEVTQAAGQIDVLVNNAGIGDQAAATVDQRVDAFERHGVVGGETFSALQFGAGTRTRRFERMETAPSAERRESASRTGVWLTPSSPAKPRVDNSWLGEM